MFFSVMISIVLSALLLSPVQLQSDPVAVAVTLAVKAGVVNAAVLTNLDEGRQLQVIAQVLGYRLPFQYNFTGSVMTQPQIDAALTDFQTNAITKLQTGDPTFALVGNALTAPNPWNPSGLVVINVVNSIVNGAKVYAQGRIYLATFLNGDGSMVGLANVLCASMQYGCLY